MGGSLRPVAPSPKPQVVARIVVREEFDAEEDGLITRIIGVPPEPIRPIGAKLCLCRVIPFGERHLRHLVSEYVVHYHGERNHQGLGNELIEPIPANTNSGEGVVRRRVRLGGVLSYYYRDAA